MNIDCLFCNIQSKKIPSTVIYEDDEFFAFLDIHPVTKGHTLVIPKTHHVWMHETPDEIISKAFIVSKKIMNAMRQSLACDYVQISVVGKDVPHFHIHLFPRRFDDNIKQLSTILYESEEEKDTIALNLKNSL